MPLAQTNYCTCTLSEPKSKDLQSHIWHVYLWQAQGMLKNTLYTKWYTYQLLPFKEMLQKLNIIKTLEK